MMRYLLFVMLLACLAGCSKSKLPKDILEPEKMQAVYWDYLRADIFANEFVRRDTSKNAETENAKLQLQVFKIHKVSKEQFYKSFDYYLKNKDLMKAMLDTMLARRKQKVDSATSKKIVTDSLLLEPVPSLLIDTIAKAL